MYQYVRTNIYQYIFTEEQFWLPLLLAMRTVLCAEAEITYSRVYVQAHIETVELPSHRIMHSKIARAAGQNLGVTKRNEAGP